MKKTCIALFFGLVGALGSGGAFAHGPGWSVALGSGGVVGFSVGVPAPVYAPVHVAPRVVYAPPIYAAPVHAPPVYVAPGAYGPAPVHYGGYHHGYHRHHGAHAYYGGPRPHGHWPRY